MPPKKSKSSEPSIPAKYLIGAIIVAFIAYGTYLYMTQEEVVPPIKKPITTPTATPRVTEATPARTATPPPIPTHKVTVTQATPATPKVTEATPPPTAGATATVQPTQTIATPIPTQAQLPSYVSGYFESGSYKGRRISVPQGSSVALNLILSGSGSGTLKVEIKRDFDSWVTDNIKTTIIIPLTLNGEQSVNAGTFNADDLTGQNNFRQYFFKLYWNDKVLYDPTYPDVREAVITMPSQAYTISINNIGFSTGNNQPQDIITVSKGTPVNVWALVTSQGAASGTVTVEVRKDIIGYDDASVTTQSKLITVNAGQSWQEITTFYPDQTTGGWLPGSLRQYFARATTISGTWEYNPEDPNTRPHVEVK